MDHPERDELISAYLDDELSPTERGEVERRLAEDPGSRQLLSELQSLRSTLQGLPRVALPTDLADRVLRRAEREMLSGAHRARPATIRIPTSHRARSTPDDWRRFVPRSKRFWRPVGYVSATIAAALMLILLTEQQDTELAIAPQPRYRSSEKQLRQESAPVAVDHPDQPEAAPPLTAPETPAPQAALRSRMAGAGNAAKPSAPPMAAAVVTEPESLVVECQVPADTNGDDLLLTLLKKHDVRTELPESLIDKADAVTSSFYQSRDAGGAVYVVHATRSQLDAVLAELHAESSPLKKIEVRTALPAELEDLKLRRADSPRMAATEKSFAAEPTAPADSASESIAATKGKQQPRVEAIFFLRPAKPTAE